MRVKKKGEKQIHTERNKNGRKKKSRYKEKLEYDLVSKASF
jgi:hypothetical protein